jgi:O-antigen ligase
VSGRAVVAVRVGLARLALVCSVLLFVPGLLEQFETPKSAVLRVLGLGLLGVLAPRFPRRRAAGLHPADVAVGAWLAVEVAATAFSVSPRVSLLGDLEQHEGLLTSLGLAGLYVAFRLHHDVPARVARSLALWLLALAGASLYAIAQASQLDLFRWARAPEYWPGLSRPFGTLGHPNLLGALGAAGLAMVVTLPYRTRLAWLRLTLAAVIALATVLTLSRGAWFAAVAALGVAWGLARFARAGERPGRRVSWPAAAVAVGLLALLVLGPWAAPLRARVGQVFAAGEMGARLEIWATALGAWQARPWLGHGPDTFGMMFSHFQTPEYWRREWAGLPVNAHSVPLHALATRGALGLLAGLVALTTVVLAAVQAWRAGGERRALVPPLAGVFVGTGLAGLLNPIGVGAAALIVMAAASLAALASPVRAGIASAPRAAPAPATSGRPAADPRRSARRPAAGASGPTKAAWLAGAVLALGALAWSAIDLRGSWTSKQGRFWSGRAPALPPAERDRALLQAIAWARLAVRVDPWSDHHWQSLAEAALLGSLAAPSLEASLREAEAAARRAVTLTPLRADHHQSLGNILFTRAQLRDTLARAEGERAFSRALELAPVNALIMLDLARDELIVERPERALEPARRAAALYPEHAPAHALLGQAFDRLGRADSARFALARALAANWRGDTSGVAGVRERLARLR